MPESHDRVLAGAAYVTLRLRARYADVEYVGNQRSLHIWRVRLPAAPPLMLRFSSAALASTRPQLQSWLDSIDRDERPPPAPPGYYQVGRGGIRVVGVDELTFDEHAQRIHCYIDPGPPPMWRVDVDGRDGGSFMTARQDDSRDEVARHALDHLYISGQLRVPAPPWQWSVIDTRGREWWARIVLPHEAREAEPGRQLAMLDRATGRQHRVPWEDPLATPGPQQLRQLLGLLDARTRDG